MAGHWRLEQEYTPTRIQSMTNAQLHDLVLDIRLAVKEKKYSKTKGYDLLILVSSELIRR